MENFNPAINESLESSKIEKSKNIPYAQMVEKYPEIHDILKKITYPLTTFENTKNMVKDFNQKNFDYQKMIGAYNTFKFKPELSTSEIAEIVIKHYFESGTAEIQVTRK